MMTSCRTCNVYWNSLTKMFRKCATSGAKRIAIGEYGRSEIRLHNVARRKSSSYSVHAL